MPKKSAVAEKGPEVCILRMGKANNIIQWKDQMYILATGLYGTTGTFFNTNRSYAVPFPTKETIIHYMEWRPCLQIQLRPERQQQPPLRTVIV